MKYTLHMRNLIHFSVGDKAKMAFKTNFSYDCFLDTNAIISPSGLTEKLS
jgi:hypothetical protein